MSIKTRSICRVRSRAIATLLCLGMSLFLVPAGAAEPVSPGGAARAVFGQEQPSSHVRELADWALEVGDNQGMPFVIIDKSLARVFVFSAQGRLLGAAPALLGLARGDHSIPGIGQRKLSTIRPEERTTPAGRFVASIARNLHGEDILWVDYEAAISLHRVIDVPKERRLQRLDSPTPSDHRISFGCINVPVKFYEGVVGPAFTGTSGIVYVLPEIRSLHDVFSSYNVDERAKLKTPGAHPGSEQL
ncbi:MAG: hypothetical protein JWQ72_455 [Polaromonas sp.]|nr:hypothetical protein [Polaromonas sp.]